TSSGMVCRRTPQCTPIATEDQTVGDRQVVLGDDVGDGGVAGGQEHETADLEDEGPHVERGPSSRRSPSSRRGRKSLVPQEKSEVPGTDSWRRPPAVALPRRSSDALTVEPVDGDDDGGHRYGEERADDAGQQRAGRQREQDRDRMEPDGPAEHERTDEV